MSGRSPLRGSGLRPDGLSQSPLSQAKPLVPNATDAAINAAVKRRQEILRLLPSLSAELKRLDAFIDTWHDMMGRPRPQKAKRAAMRNRINQPREEIAEACLSILIERGAPLNRKELLVALAERQIVINGKDPLMTLSTMLWRSGDVIVRTSAGYLPAASCDTHPQDGDVKQAPLVSGAVGKAETPNA